MSFQPVENTAGIELRYSVNGEMVENTLYFLRNQSIGLAAITALTMGIADWWHGVLRPYQHSGLTFTECFGRDLTTESGYNYHDYRYAGHAGGYVSGTISPNNVSFAITLRTGKIGRCYRGRNFAAAISSQVIEGNQIGVTFANYLRDSYLWLVAPSSYYTTTWQWCVVSRWYNKTKRLAGLSTPITAVGYYDLNIDSQRYRLTGRPQ